MKFVRMQRSINVALKHTLRVAACVEKRAAPSGGGEPVCLAGNDDWEPIEPEVSVDSKLLRCLIYFYTSSDSRTSLLTERQLGETPREHQHHRTQGQV